MLYKRMCQQIINKKSIVEEKCKSINRMHLVKKDVRVVKS